jgi:hypothetical protein
VAEGERLVSGMPREQRGYKYWLQGEQVAPYSAWLVSCAHLLQIAAPPGSHFVGESTKLLAEINNPAGIMTSTVSKMRGVLQSASSEWTAGLMRSIEYIVAAATFDDFLDHAAEYHKGGKKVEAAVLGSAVFEDAIKRICSKHKIPSAGKTVDPLIDDLTAAGVFTGVKAKRAKAYAGVRNHALHAEWDKFDLKDVGQMVEGVRELIEDHL